MKEMSFTAMNGDIMDLPFAKQEPVEMTESSISRAKESNYEVSYLSTTAEVIYSSNTNMLSNRT